MFQGKNLFHFLNSKHKDQAVSKNTYYRFLNESSYNWKKFLLLLSARVVSAFDRLTRPERVKYKKSECLYLLSTDCSLSDSEIVRIYGNRWSIKCFFKASKSCLKVGTEFQSRNYDAMISHTSIVFTRYMILEWIRRNENDQKTYGELFFMLCDDIQDMDFTNALQGLLSLFTDIATMVSADITELIKSKVSNWMKSQPLFIQALFRDLYWGS